MKIVKQLHNPHECPVKTLADLNLQHPRPLNPTVRGIGFGVKAFAEVLDISDIRKGCEASCGIAMRSNPEE